MTREDYDAFCGSLPHATHVVQWGDASVWKIGGKVFAIGGWFDGPEFAVTFKCSKTSFAILSELPGLRPAPYLASRGLLWMQRVDMRAFSDHDLKALHPTEPRDDSCGAPEENSRGVEGSHLTVTVTPSDIRAAHARIRDHIRRTPLLETASPIARRAAAVAQA